MSKNRKKKLKKKIKKQLQKNQEMLDDADKPEQCNEEEPARHDECANDERFSPKGDEGMSQGSDYNCDTKDTKDQLEYPSGGNDAGLNGKSDVLRSDVCMTNLDGHNDDQEEKMENESSSNSSSRRDVQSFGKQMQLNLLLRLFLPLW